MLLLAVMMTATAMAQSDKYMVAGTVMDENGEPLIGVTVSEKGNTGNGALTDLDGKFRVKDITDGSTLSFTYIGYKEYTYKVKDSKEGLKIVMQPDISALDEVVVVGAGSQKKISLTGAITTIEPEKLDAPATSISNMLGGNVPGIIAVTRSGEPGDDFSEFWIRGISTFGASSSALVLIDGVEGNLNDIDASDVESFTVLKDASATAIYGVQGANGVVIVTTKTGKAGKLAINFKTNLIMSESARMPEYCDAYTYATLANEARISHDLDPMYNDTELELFRTGLDPDLYPNTNWRDVILKDHVWQNQHFLSIRGGGANARYYVALSVQNKAAVFKQDKSINEYNTNVDYHKYTFRSNIDLNLTKTTALSLKMTETIVNQNSPGLGDNNQALWSAQANLTPVMFPVMYSNGYYPAKSGSSNDEISPYVQLNMTGFKEKRRIDTDLKVSLTQDLKMITPGLKLSALFAFASESQHNITRSKQPDMYRATGRYADGSLIFTKTRSKSDLSFSKYVYNSRFYQWEIKPEYNRSFGDHDFGALARFYLQSETNSDADDNKAAIPHRYESLSGRVTYGFKRTYFAELNLGYTGSEQFPKHHRFGLFPAVSGGWIPTQYNFMRKALPWLNYFKLRVSYGIVGNDEIGGTRFPYLTTITTGSSGWNSGYSSYREDQVGTDGLQWEKAKKFDVGVDAHFLSDMITLTVDYFRDVRDGIFQQRATVPLEIGLQTLPYANVGSMESWGFDGNAAFSKNFGKDWTVTARANFTFSRNKVTNWEQSGIRYPYQSYTGVPYGILRGLIAIGLFKDQDDIDSSPRQTFESKIYPGDIKYKDVNGDGVIDTDDVVPLSYSNTPEFQYGFAPEVRWKNLTVSALFEGTAHSEFFYGGTGFYPFAWEGSGNVLTIVADQKNRWTSRDISGDPATENPNARFPRLTYGENKNNNRASTFWLADNSYLRFKNLTIRYRYTNDWLKKVVSVQNIDVSFIVNNICTWDNIKLWDPGQVNGNGAQYPIQRTYTLQLNVNF